MKLLSKLFIVIAVCCSSFSAYSQCLQIDGIPDLTLPTTVCSGEAVTLCLPYTSLDLACLNYDFTANIDNTVVVEDVGGQLCITVTAINMTCDPIDAIVSINDLSCCDGSEPCADLGFPIGCIGLGAAGVTFPLDLAPITVFPQVYTVDVVAPDCAGGAGSATLTAEDGTVCLTVPGIPGVPNVCPLTVDVDADLAFDFTAFTTPCYTGPVQASAPIDCNVDCSGGGAVCDALAGEPLVTPEEVCDTDAGAFDVSAAFDPATGGYDDGAGNVDPVNTNYVAVDQATGAILGVATSAATLDLSGAPVGTVACVYQLAYTQGLLDDVTTFLDDLLCNTLCVPVVGPCLGDVGYCPGVTPVELAPFLDILNQFFGFDEAAICNFLDNQIITIPDPTGLIGDQMIDLAANGLDFCADKSDAPYCVEIISCMTDACTAMAGEAMAGAPTVACNDAASPIDANTIFDPAMGGYDNDGDGVVDDPVSTNYIAVDAAGDIISVSAAGASTLDLSSLADGETACIYQLAYTQGTLDAVTGFVDNLLCNTLCVPITGPCLGDVGYCPGVTPVEFAPFLDLLNGFFGFNEAQICNFIDNQIITIPDPTGLIGDQMIDLAANGLDFCVDKSEVYCVTIDASTCPVVADDCTAMAGEAMAGAPTVACNDAASPIDANTIFDPAMGGYDNDGDGVVDDPVSTNYIAVDAAGDIISVSAAGASTLDLSSLADGETACIYQLAYTQGTLDAVTGFVDNLLCNTLCVPITGPCLGDVGYCPGVTPVEFAPFLDLLNGFFGFNEAQICNFIDNQIITITDPTGLIGDQMIDLAANGLDFCVDKSEAFCVTIDASTCPVVADACTAMAGEAMAGAPTEVCNDAASPVDANTIFDPAMGGYDSDGDGVVDAMVSTNYIAVDAAGDIVAVTAAGATTLDLSSLADGETACIYQLAYTQGTLDAVTGFVDNLLCNTLCVPITGPCLGDVGYCPGVTPVEFAPFLDLLNTFFGFNEVQICNFIDNQIITITDPTGLIGDQEIDLVALGIDFCVDKSAVYCVTVNSSACPNTACEADAPELDPATGDCAADDGDMMETPFTWPLNAASTENTTAPYITEYIVTDAATGNIIGVFPTLAAAEAAANTEITTDADGNATACIQPINHDSDNFEALVTSIDADAGGLLCGSGIIVCPVTTLEALYAGLAGAGIPIDVATVVGLVGAPNAGNPGLDLGALLGLPIPLVVDVPAFCYELGVEVCATNAACPAMCDPAIAAATAPAAEVPSESTCEANGMTLSGGVIAAPATACPMGSTLEYSTDAGATWSTTLPTYDQMNAVTVDTRCVCDIDTDVVSLTGTVTTVPGMCTATCDPAIAAATAPPVVITSESTCPDGMTLGGGALADATGCPMGSMVQYSVGGGAFSSTLPTYNQTTAETITTQCVCTSDPAIVSMPTDVTTAPGVCAPMCSIMVDVTSMCDDQDTPDDDSDDVTTYLITLTGNNAGTGFTATVAPDMGTLTYGTQLTYTVTGTGGLSVTFEDDTNAGCTAAVNQSSGCGTVENIPTVGEWGLIILGLLMSIAAVVGIRQRREEEVYS